MKKQLSALFTKSTQLVAKNQFLIKKYSPEILLGFGLVTATAMSIELIRETMKLQPVLDESNAKISQVRQALKEDKSFEKEYKKELFYAYVSKGVNVAKLYTPAVLLGAVSVTSILSSYKIIKGRNVAIMAAYKVVDSSFKKYRSRVIEALGEEKDYEFSHGTTKNKIEEEQKESGQKLPTKGYYDPSQYARFFDETNSYWSPIPEYNLLFLRSQQNYANDKLRSRSTGHLFLNEVYDMLGLPHTSEGAFVGWKITKDGKNDNRVDFGLFDRASTNPGVRAFVNGLEPAVLLDFNVDGIIYDLI